MKFLAISDTHGDVDNVIKFIKKNIKDKIEGIFFLGDYVEDGEKISKELELETYIVAGNGDFHSDYPDDLLLNINQKKILLTHGHRYKLGYDLTTLFYRGLELSADLILYGHTHVPVITKEDDILIINPGSPSYPRSKTKEKTIALIDIENKIIAKIISID